MILKELLACHRCEVTSCTSTLLSFGMVNSCQWQQAAGNSELTWASVPARAVLTSWSGWLLPSTKSYLWDSWMG